MRVKVKICGLVHPEDALLAGRLGADLCGVVLAKGRARSVDEARAREVVAAVLEGGSRPVGVFVDEDAASAAALAERLGITTLQLHGEGSRRGAEALGRDFSLFFAVPVGPDGRFDLPDTTVPLVPLFDGGDGGAGSPFPWNRFHPPAGEWILAGGLTPENVAGAVRRLRPWGVDVSSGVCGADGLWKDPIRMKRFIDAAKRWEEA